METTKCLIIGSGPAGYTAAIYLSRAGISSVLYSGIQPGGQLTQTTTIENYPGFPQGVEGFDLMENMRQQAVNVGAEVRNGIITDIDLSKRPFVATVDGTSTISADAVIIATGASAKYLGLADEQKYAGMGVSACATCDGFFYRKKVVAVVGGGDTACEEAYYLSNLAKKVYMIVRKPYLRASAAMQQRVNEKENIEILYNTNTVGLFGEQFVEGAHLVQFKGTDKEQMLDIDIDGFFLAIGHKPNTDFLKDQVALDEQGYIALGGITTETSVKGVFAAGDVADPHYRQAIVAAGSGCRAALDAKSYLDAL
ncbi:MAG: thioredoxin-disulfide reductase [Bacteroidales bacterium]|nr:thioredoxin-disulfide reductase [Bacteroidales bacterium]MCI7317089.1 thioredoxin-disulfide reductase [Bacteroidales bacterium]MCI7585612.1 thioredoxin-disulfide reductase [Bacteroidales bacterium]MDD7576263.1 thioredoxin-disulfide reductase [Bacteroidales bacterium]MDY5867962.1 thioredoxin-disulfide reductase [Sodaliphilus sp.]